MLLFSLQHFEPKIFFSSFSLAFFFLFIIFSCYFIILFLYFQIQNSTKLFYTATSITDQLVLTFFLNQPFAMNMSITGMALVPVDHITHCLSYHDLKVKFIHKNSRFYKIYKFCVCILIRKKKIHLNILLSNCQEFNFRYCSTFLIFAVFTVHTRQPWHFPFKGNFVSVRKSFG